MIVRCLHDALVASIALALAALVVVSTARAQPDPLLIDDATGSTTALRSFFPSDEELRGIPLPSGMVEQIGALGNEQFMVRERAMIELLADSVAPLDLLAALAQCELDSEQRFRLLEVLERKLVTVPRGALGISMNNLFQLGGDLPGVQVRDLVAGFPAAEVLEINDWITHIDGVVVNGAEELIRQVQFRRPGDTVALTVDRAHRDQTGMLVRDADGRQVFDTLTIELALGSAAELEQTSLRPQASPVVQQRSKHAEDAAVRYGPKPRRIETASGGAAAAGSLSEEELTAHLVRNHQYIRTARRQIEMIERRELQLTAQLRSVWAQQLRTLRDAADQPGLSDEERNRLRVIAGEFERLIRPYL